VLVVVYDVVVDAIRLFGRRRVTARLLLLLGQRGEERLARVGDTRSRVSRRSRSCSAPAAPAAAASGENAIRPRWIIMEMLDSAPS
jgi:hypothetical protein